MNPEVRWSEPAEEDLRDIFHYIGIERQSIDAARRLVRSIRDKAEAYARQPGMGTLHEEIEIPGEAGPVRSFCVKSYLAFYLETPSSIFVLRVIHGRRDFPSLF